MAQDGELQALYVMDKAGIIYTSAKLKAANHHAASAGTLPALNHAVLARSQPVVAAGIMTICNGHLTHLSNESGHYTPPASCLRSVLDKLYKLGVDSLMRSSLWSCVAPTCGAR